MRMIEVTKMSADQPIILSLNYFEHLLNCLANQKYLHELNTEGLRETREESQRIIDDAWNEGMRLLSEAQRFSRDKSRE